MWYLFMWVYHDVTGQTLLAHVSPRVTATPSPVTLPASELTKYAIFPLIRCLYDMIVVDVMIKFTYSATFSCSYDDINDLFY
jgi:hypothetical protein